MHAFFLLFLIQPQEHLAVEVEYACLWMAQDLETLLGPSALTQLVSHCYLLFLVNFIEA